MTNHPGLESQRERVVMAEGQKLQAGLKPNFTLYLQSENTRFWGQPKFNYPNASDNWAYLGQTIESGGKRQRRVDFAQAQLERSKLDQDLLARQLALRVTNAYWAAAAATRLAQLAREQAASFAPMVENNRQRVKEGVLPGVDLMRSQIEQRRWETAAQQMESEARRSRLQLFREMAAEDTGAPLSDPLDEPRDLGRQDASRVENRVEWQQANQTIRSAEANIQLQTANGKPDPMWLYGYKRTSGFDTILGGVIVDLAFRNRNQGAVAAAIAERRSAEAQRRALRIQIEADLRTAANDAASRRRLLDETLRPAQQDTEEVVSLARKAYLEGGVDLLRLIDAERVYFETRMQVVRTQLEWRQAEAQLAFALGEEP